MDLAKPIQEEKKKNSLLEGWWVRDLFKHYKYLLFCPRLIYWASTNWAQLTPGRLWATENTGLSEMIRVFGVMLGSMGRRQAIDKATVSVVLYPDNGLSCRVFKLSVLDLSPFPLPLPLISFACFIAFGDSPMLGKSRKLHVYPTRDFGRRMTAVLHQRWKELPHRKAS